MVTITNFNEETCWIMETHCTLEYHVLIYNLIDTRKSQFITNIIYLCSQLFQFI